MAVGDMDRPPRRTSRRRQLPVPALEPHLRVRLDRFVGDWRSAGIPSMAQAYNRPFHVRGGRYPLGRPGRGGELPRDPAIVGALERLKPLGNPMASQAAPMPTPAVACWCVSRSRAAGPPRRRFAPSPRSVGRLSHRRARGIGRPTSGRRGEWPLRSADSRSPALGRFPEVIQFARLRTRPIGPRPSPLSRLCRLLVAQQGAAPLGYQPVTVRVSPRALVERAFQRRRGGGFGADRCPGCRAGRAAAASRLVGRAGAADVPPGAWSAPPVHGRGQPRCRSESGRYFVAARIGDEGGQVHEDTVTVEYRRDGLDASTHGRAR